MNNSLRFLNAYAEIEGALNRQFSRSSYVPYSNLLHMAKNSNLVVRNYFQKLKEYGELRNAIVHQRGNNLEVIAEPTDSVTDEIEHIAELLNRDQNILSYATTPVLVCDYDETLESTWRKISKKNFSKLPVYEGKTLKGLITSSEIIGWLMKGGSKDALIKDVMKNNHADRIVFMKKNKTIQEAIQVFDQAFSKGKNPPVILITAHGSENEYPEAIISSSDLSKMLSALA